MLDLCPQSHLQKLCDILVNNNGDGPCGGIATFGANVVAGIIGKWNTNIYVRYMYIYIF
jgi:hypothetical protein